MEIADHIAALELEGVRLVCAAQEGDLLAPVPACPGWQLRDLLAHIGFVHRWATRYVATRLTTAVDELDEKAILSTSPDVEHLVAWVSEGHGALVEALRSAPADLACWTFLDAPSPLAMWARRQAHETAVHRVDAQQAAGDDVAPVGADLAADGIEELLFCFYGRSGVPDGEQQGRFGLVPNDRNESWTVSMIGGRVAGSCGLEDCDVLVRASSSDLYLLLWNRVGAEVVDLDGTVGSFQRLWAPKGVTWQ